jgi:hypothetical protein
MARSPGGLCVIAVLTLGALLGVRPDANGRNPADDKPAAPRGDAAGVGSTDLTLTGSTVSALLDANGGKPPATGKQLWDALSKMGEFAQLPVVFSTVRLESGVGAPRVVIAPVVNGLSNAGVTEPNLNGRLFLAANMERSSTGADPWVGSVEFISWNTLRRKFDFGVIENMGGEDAPRLRVVDGGRCFACHKNKGPILGAAPWTNTVHREELRVLVAARLNMIYTIDEPAGFGGPGKGRRDRIDGMALSVSNAPALDPVVRLGASLALRRDTFRLLPRYEYGRKGLEAMLVAVVAPGPLDTNDRAVRAVFDKWYNDPSGDRFIADWVALARTTNTGILRDYIPSNTGLNTPGVVPAGWRTSTRLPFAPVPQTPPGGFATALEADVHKQRVQAAVEGNARLVRDQLGKLALVVQYDEARAAGRHGIPSSAQPSNLKAFELVPVKAPAKPSDLVNPLMLASTIGLSVGDRKFLGDALADAARRLADKKVTPAALAREVFEGPEFAGVMAGEALPDRDEFKDRFVAGLNTVLTSRYELSDGFAPERREYASGPRRDPKTVEAVEAAVVPTSACLRCHDVHAATKGPGFEQIPALRFDPLDKKGRAEWVRAADYKRKQEYLALLKKRLFADADMPPQDSPEHKAFRVEQAAAFDDLKRFVAVETEKLRKP